MHHAEEHQMHYNGHHQQMENNKCCRECGEIGAFLPCCWEGKMDIKARWGNYYGGSSKKKLNVHLVLDSQRPVLGMYAAESKAASWKDCLGVHVHGSIILKSHGGEAI